VRGAQRPARSRLSLSASRSPIAISRPIRVPTIQSIHRATVLPAAPHARAISPHSGLRDPQSAEVRSPVRRERLQRCGLRNRRGGQVCCTHAQAPPSPAELSGRHRAPRPANSWPHWYEHCSRRTITCGRCATYICAGSCGTPQAQLHNLKRLLIAHQRIQQHRTDSRTQIMFCS